MITLLALACAHAPDPTPKPAEAGPLEVGVARVRMPVPVGIGTVGYGGFTVHADPTPFAEIYPGTTTLHDHPSFEAIAISRGPGFELVFLRSDTIGVFQQLRRAVVQELQRRLGRDLDDALIIGATHTHSGPGRVLDAGGPFELIADRFFPEFYDRMVGAMADAVEQSLADLRPGRVGTGFAYTDDGHDDRRCEDGQDHLNGRLPLVAVEQEGTLVGLVTTYAVHGTVLGIEDLTLSEDVAGGIEQAVADRFDHDVVVAELNSWAADMSPANPVVPTQPAAVAPSGYDQMEAVGQVVADAVEDALPDLEWTDTPDIELHTMRVPLSREALGYADGEFPYNFGAVYCTSTTSDCDPATVEEGLDHACLPFNYDYPAPDRTEITAGHLGDLGILTFPGEPGTLLAEQILAEVGEERMLFVGYAQDYTGYSILEDDWWQGGYEASGSLWGPKQGQYLADSAVRVWNAAAAGEDLDDQPDPVDPFDIGAYAPYAAPDPVGLGSVAVDVAASYGPLDVVELTVDGADAWFGAPVATLQHADGTPVLRPNGAPLTSDGQAFWLDLSTDPTYGDAPGATARTFSWRFHLPLTHAVVGAIPALTGALKIHVDLPDGQGGTVGADSTTFTVSGG